MPIPLSIILFDRGASGVPTTNNPVNLAGKAESYEDTLSDRYGFETARTSWTPTRADILEWARADHLLRPMVAYSPDARIAWEGFLAEIEIELGTKKIAFSLKDMANRLTVRYSTPGGGQGDSTTYSSAASHALYGIKDRVINASIAASAAANNQAQTLLNILAFPRSKQPSTAGTPRGGLQITLTFWGKYALLDWLLTSSTTTTSTATNTQVGSLLAAYAAVNAFFSSSTANIVATGISDTEYTEPDTTYREKIERLLARGNSSQQPLAWGFYEGGVFKVEARASATPSTITYYESEASGEIRDAYGNVVDPWDVRPNAMALVTDLIDAPLVGAAESPLRKYVAKVRRSVRGNEVSVGLDPDDVESVESLLTGPAGAGPAGTSERQAAFERKVMAPARSVFPGVDDSTRYDRTNGVWKPIAGGTGKANTGTIDLGSGSIATGGGSISTGGGSISTGGGSISTGGGSINTGGGTVSNTGGGAVDLGTGSGIGGAGSSGVSTAGGTAGRVAEWSSTTALTASTLIKSGAGVLTLSASGAFTLTVPATGTAALGTGTGGSLAKWSTTNTLAAATASDLPSHTHTHSDITDWNEAVDDRVGALITAGTNITVTYNDAGNTLTIDAADAPIDGSGTAGRVAQWSDSNTLTSATLIKSGAGVLTLSAASTATLTIDSTTRIDGSGASSGDALVYNGTAYAPTALTAADVSAAPVDAKYIVQTANSTLTNEQALGALATGILKNTTTTGVLSIATGSDLPSHTHTSSDISNFNEAVDDRVDALLVAGSNITLTYNDTSNTLTIAAAGSSGITGSGTTGRVAYFDSSSSVAADVLYWDATNNRLGVNQSSPTDTLHVGGDIRCTGAVSTQTNNAWGLGDYTASAILSNTGVIAISIDGTSYELLARIPGS